MEQGPPVWLIPLVVVIVIGAVGLFALIFIPMLVRIARNASTTKQVMQTGSDATATIVRTWDTGVRINDNPQVGMLLQVQPPGGAPFQAEVTKTVSIVEMARFQPGAQLQVKYDPAQPSRVAIVAVIAGGLSSGGPIAGSMMNAQQAEQVLTLYQRANEQLLQSGRSATAKVLHYMPMGVNVNGNNPAVTLIVEVQPAEGPAFTGQAQGCVIAESAVHKYQPGQVVTVRYDPNDLTRVALERSGA